MIFEVRSDGYADEIPGTEPDEPEPATVADIVAGLPNPATGLSDPHRTARAGYEEYR